MRSWDTDFAKEFQKRNNPVDLKEGIIGIVLILNPLTVSIENGQVILVENDLLIISEWFKKRWQIDKTSALSADVPGLLSSATSTTIINAHGATCAVNAALASLSQAISKVNAELLQLKLDLKVKDKVILIPADIPDKYFLMDKVL